MSVTLGALSCVLDAYGLIRVGLVETVERGERVCQPPTPGCRDYVLGQLRRALRVEHDGAHRSIVGRSRKESPVG